MVEHDNLENIIRDRIGKEHTTFPEKLNDRIKNVIRELPESNDHVGVNIEQRVKINWRIAATAASLVLIIATSVLVFNRYGRGGADTRNTLITTIGANSEALSELTKEQVSAKAQDCIEKLKLQGYITEKNNQNIDSKGGAFSTADKIRSYDTVEELVSASDLIIQGQVLAVRYFDKETMTYTESKVLVTKSYNDKAKAGDIVTFCESGGYTTRYNMYKYSGAEEKFGGIYKMTPEEEEKAKHELVYSFSAFGTSMQPEDRVILFGSKGSEGNGGLIKGTYYWPVGGSDGKFVLKDNTAVRGGEGIEASIPMKMSIGELDGKLNQIIKNKITVVNVPKLNPEGVNSIIIKRSEDKSRQKVVTKKKDIEKIISYLNSIDYKYASEKNWTLFNYSLQIQGDKEHFIGFSGSYIKYDGKWYSVSFEELYKTSRGTEELYNSLDYKEESVEGK